MNTKYRKISKDNAVLAMVAYSVVFTMFLFFIDEGYYNFNWMQDPGNWAVFPFYAIPILLFGLFIHYVVLMKYKGSAKIALSLFLGSIAGIIFTVFVIFGVVL